MVTAGIIAEYNPFHNGHKYHLEQTRQQTGADYIVAVMSGDFVQRGIPAIADKFTRARMALMSGVDVVFELPCIYATSSAELFSEAAVTFLQQTGVIDVLSFGAENASLSTLSRIARVLNDEPEGFREILQDNLREGMSYPRAVYGALTRFMLENTKSSESAIEQAYIISTQLSLPNNILGIEYLKALTRIGSNIRPFCLERKGSGYNTSMLRISEFGSSFAIREALYNGPGLAAVRRYVPDFVYQSLSDGKGKILPVFMDDLSSYLNYSLLSSDFYEKASDMTQEIANRIRNMDKTPRTVKAWAELLKTKNVTLAHVNRSLIHTVLQISKEDIIQARAEGLIPYVRILGFRESAAPLLTKLKQNCSVPILTKTADAGKLLSAQGQKLFSMEVKAHELYRQLIYQKFRGVIPDDYRAGVIKV